MSSPAKIQTVGEATNSIKGVVQSTFSSLSNFFNFSSNVNLSLNIFKFT